MPTNRSSRPRLRLLGRALAGALVGLRSERLLSTVVVATLALAFAGVTLVANAVDRLYLRPFPEIESVGQVDRIFEASDRRPDATSQLTWEDWRDLEESAGDAFAGLTATSGLYASLVAGDEPERVLAFAVDDGYFDLLGVEATEGRLIDGALSTEPVAVLSHALWQRAFGGDAAAVGRSIRLNGEAFTVIGVTPRDFRGVDVLGGPDLWVPLESFASTAAGIAQEFRGKRNREQRWLDVTARRAPGVAVEQAQAQLDVIASRLAALPEHDDDHGYRLRAAPLLDSALGRQAVGERWLTLFAGAVVLVLLAACSNVGGLLTGRLLRRTPELAVRLALGEGRGLLVATLLAETLLLTLAGAVGGLAIATLLGPLPGLGPFGQVDSTPRLGAAAASLGLAALCAFAIGIFPALRAARRGTAPLLRTASSTGDRRLGARDGLVAFQIAICFLVLVGAVLTTRVLYSLRAIPLGFAPDRLISASLDVAERGWDASTRNAFFDELVERLDRDPSVERAALVSALPMVGSDMSTSLSFEILGREDAERGETPGAYHALADPSLLPTLGARIVAGRNFQETDDESAPPVALVNEAAARAHWLDQSPVGARLQLVQTDEPVTVVGVFSDARLHQLEEEPAPGLLLAHAQAERSWIGQILGPSTTVLVRSSGEADPAIATIRRQVRELDPELPVFSVTTLDQRLASLMRTERLAARTFTFAALLALALSILGLFATAAHAVARRTRELGIRSACGATPRDLLALILRRAILLAALGVAFGAAVAGPLGRQVQTQLREQAVVDPLLFSAIGLALVVVAALSVLAPARRAARVDPVRALRME